MRTRLTELLDIEHPVMRGVSYHRLVAAVSEAGGFGCLGASTMAGEEMGREIAAVRDLTDKPFGVDLLTAAPGDMVARVEQIIAGGASVFVAGLGVPRDAIDLCHRRGGPGRQHVRQGPARRRRRRHLRRAGPGGGARPRGRRGVGRHAVHRHARGQDGGGYKDVLVRTGEDGTVISRAYRGKTCRVIANDYTRYFEEHPDELQPFPAQVGRAAADGAFHLGGDETTTGVDLGKEFLPAGQGTGAIHAVVPAGELVRRFATEAEEVLDRLAETQKAHDPARRE